MMIIIAGITFACSCSARGSFELSRQMIPPHQMAQALKNQKIQSPPLHRIAKQLTAKHEVPTLPLIPRLPCFHHLLTISSRSFSFVRVYSEQVLSGR